MEIIADYKQHQAGEREVVNWDRPDGHTYFDVPVVYIREVSEADYLEQKPHMAGKVDRAYFWEVSVD